jgi:hypothetical protein
MPISTAEREKPARKDQTTEVSKPVNKPEVAREREVWWETYKSGSFC